MTTTDAVQWADVSVAEIRRTDGEDIWQRKYMMILQEPGGGRGPMWTRPAEATA